MNKQATPRLDAVDLTRKLGKKSYATKLARLQRQLAEVQQAYLFSGDKAVLVFEGWDAAGKGGAIRRISAALDPRSFKVWPIGAPRNYYLDRHYMVRFMERLPPAGAISAFDRSWYGRVLVERIEELTPAQRWQDGYREIRHFERMLADDGIRLVKLFFHISPDEQLARFGERLRNPFKRWKLTYEDFRNRSRWDDYAAAIDQMFAETSTEFAPWTVISANNKRHARIAAMQQILDVLTPGVDLGPPELDHRVLHEAGNHFGADDALINSLSGRTE